MLSNSLAELGSKIKKLFNKVLDEYLKYMARKKVIKCACCDEKIDEESDFGYGGEGTKYEDKIVCEGCYYDDDPYATLYFSNEFEEFEAGDPLFICCCRNDTQGEFTAKWVSTDAWRGYYEIESKNWKILHDDCILSMSQDADNLEEFDKILMKKLEELAIPYVRAFARTSNCCSCGYDLFVPKDTDAEQVMKAVEQDKERLRNFHDFNSTALTGSDPKDQTETDKKFVKAVAVLPLVNNDPQKTIKMVNALDKISKDLGKKK